MKNKDIRAAANVNFRANYGIDIHLYRPNPDDSVDVAMPLQMVRLDAGAADDSGPLVTLSRAAGQDLMNDLWRAGFRPSNGDGNEGQSAAMQAHLKDLRAIAFHALKMPETSKP